MGYLLRWNILAYKVLPINDDYDLICLHHELRQIR